MNIDTGLAAVILAVLVFYLRLIVLQRESAKRARQALLDNGKQRRKSGGARPSSARPSSSRPSSSRLNAAGGSRPQATPDYSILSKNRVDRMIGGAGALAIMIGVLAYAGIISLPALQSYWWLPTSAGIVAFSWAFKLPR